MAFSLGVAVVSIAAISHAHRVGAAATYEAVSAQREYLDRAGHTRFALYSSDLLAQCVRAQLLSAASARNGLSRAFDTAHWARATAPVVRKACGQKVAAHLATLQSAPRPLAARASGIRIAAVDDSNLTERENPR